MSSISTYSIGLGPRELAAAFPFHIALDGETRITQVGDVIHRLLPDICPGTYFRDHFRIERPVVEPTFDAIRACSQMFFLLKSRARESLAIRGQMLPFEDGLGIVFLGSPWVTDVAEFKDLGLSLKDFALHDPISDFLFLFQTQTASLADAVGFAGELAVVNERLEERVGERTHDLQLVNRELERQIIERGRAEEEKTKLQRQIYQFQKLEAIGTLAGGIAHDFNNLLFVILGNTEIALRELTEENPLRDKLKNVLTASKRASGLVDQILTFSRQGESACQSVSLRALVKETLELLEATLPATIKIETDIDCTGGDVYGDANQLQQVVMNLCMNSYQAMGERGVLTVRLSRVEIDSRSGTDLAEPKSGPYVLLEVGDTGSGIEPGIMEKLFDPFFTTREVGKGTGLGLATVHGIVTRMTGFIRVSSELGRSTAFRVYLPEVSYQRAHESDDDKIPATASGEGQQILVVDDEPQVRAVLDDMLCGLGYIVTTCPDGEEAVEVVRAQPDRFCLIVTDQTMPNLTGAELIQKLHQIRPQLPVILATGASQLVSEEDYKEHGACAFLQKPVEVANLARVIQKSLQKSRG